MPENPFQNEDMKQYFSSLPTIIQETIEQSGIKFQSVEDLREFVNKIQS